MQPIDDAALQAQLDRLAGKMLYLHLETTQGAYTRGGSSAFARNLSLRYRRAGVNGTGPYAVGLQLESGWIYADGLTHWELDEQGRILLAGHDAQGRLAVALELSTAPFPLGQPAREGATAGARQPLAKPARGNGTGSPWEGERHLLVVLAHPDDETFACAGYIAQLTRHGVPVTCLTVTGGQMGRNMGHPPFATRETLPALRSEEYRQAMRLLGVDDVRLLGFWDKTVAFIEQAALAERILAVLREVAPSTLITFHPACSGHPDHNATGAAALAAVQRLAPEQRPRVLCPVVPVAEEVPDLPVYRIPIEEVRDLKEAAFRAHRSQTEGWDERLTENPEMQERFKTLFVEEQFWIYPLPAS